MSNKNDNSNRENQKKSRHQETNIGLKNISKIRDKSGVLRKILISVGVFLVIFVCYILFWGVDLRSREYTVELPEGTGEYIGFSDEQPLYQVLQIDKKAEIKNISFLVATFSDTVTVDEIRFGILDDNMTLLSEQAIAKDLLHDNQAYTVNLEGVRTDGCHRLYVRFTATRPNGEADVVPVIYKSQGFTNNGGLYSGGARQWGQALAMGMTYQSVTPGWSFFLVWFLILLCIVGSVFFRKRVCQNLHSILWTIAVGVTIFFLYRHYDIYNASRVNGILARKGFRNLCICFGICLCLVFAMKNYVLPFFKQRNIHFTILERFFAFCRTSKAVDRCLGIYIPLGLFLALIMIQRKIADNIMFSLGWDIQTIFGLARSIRENGLEATDLGYLKIFPNNKLLTMLFSVFMKTGLSEAENWKRIIHLNLVFVDIGLFFGGLTAGKFFGKAALYVYIVLISILIGCSGWIVVPYSDTYLLCIVSIANFLLAAYFSMTKEQIREELFEDKSAAQKRRWRQIETVSCVLVSTMLLVLGYYIKPQALILLIAFGIVFVVRSILEKKKKSVPAVLFMLLGAVLAGGLLEGGMKSFYQGKLDDAYSMPASSFLAMGLEENPQVPFGVGVYNADIALAEYNATNLTEQKNETYQNMLRNQIKNYGLKGILGHLGKKILWILDDGSFFWYGEGYFFVDDLSYKEGDMEQQQIRSYYITDDTSHKIDTAGRVSGVWYMVLFLAAFAMFFHGGREKEERTEIVWMLGLAFVGALLFTLIFEGRARYLIGYVPAIVLVASVGLVNVIKSIPILTFSSKSPTMVDGHDVS